jgi:hypothetical protein
MSWTFPKLVISALQLLTGFLNTTPDIAFSFLNYYYNVDLRLAYFWSVTGRVPAGSNIKHIILSEGYGFVVNGQLRYKVNLDLALQTAQNMSNEYRSIMAHLDSIAQNNLSSLAQLPCANHMEVLDLFM